MGTRKSKRKAVHDPSFLSPSPTSTSAAEDKDPSGASKEGRFFSSCDWDLSTGKPSEQPQTTVPLSTGIWKKFQPGYHWEGVTDQVYKVAGTDWTGVIRRVIIGAAGENVPFHLRYFEIQPGGYSSLERHQHEHLVIGIRGKGQVRVGTACHELAFLDVLYIPPHTPHQLMNEGAEPFGFFCIVHAERDAPHLLDAPERSLLGIPSHEYHA